MGIGATLVLLTLPLISASPELPSAKARLAEARAKDTALRANERKLRFRHHFLPVIRAWKEAAEANQGTARLRALEGESEAWALMAHWSGREDDRAQAQAKRRKLASLRKTQSSRKAKAAKKAKPIKKAKTVQKPASSKPAWLTALKLEQRGGKLLINLDIQGEFTMQKRAVAAKELSGRVFVDLEPVVASQKALGTLKVPKGLTSARMGQFDADTARLVLDFSKPEGRLERVQLQDTQIAVVFGKAPKLAKRAKRDKPAKAAPSPAKVSEILSKIVKEVRETLPDPKKAGPKKAESKKAEPKKTERATAPKKPAASKKAKKPAAPKVALKPLPPLPKTKLKRSTREAAKPRANKLLAIRTVVIDAGHGGKDRGASGSRGVREKDVNLAIAKKLGAALKRRLGVRVVYTRSRDRFVSLRRRAQIANKSRGDLLISVHSNANRSRKVHGIETYYLNTSSNRYNRRLAGRENGHTHSAPLADGAMGRDLRLLLADLAMRSATVESKRLAGYIQSSAVANLRKRYKNVKDLGVKSALFYVLLGSRMPSVLIETGFVSNPKEAKRLANKTYQTRMAEAIAAGVERFARERAQIARRANLMPGDGGVATQYARSAP